MEFVHLKVVLNHVDDVQYQYESMDKSDDGTLSAADLKRKNKTPSKEQ